MPEEFEQSSAIAIAKEAEAIQAQHDLLKRPRLSLRTRITMVFVLIFVLLGIITIAAVLFISEVETKQQFLEKVGNYAFEIQQARRYEKNYFLYGSNLADALANVHMADNYLKRNGDEVKAVVGNRRYESMKLDLNRYQALLQKLLQEPPGDTPEKRRIEVELRQSGTQILHDAQEAMDEERTTMRSMLSTYMVTAISFLIFMFFVMAYIAGFLVRSMIRPLGRFMKYAARIGAGDYTPITPTRKYRDEFSNLAMAINKMLSELVTRQEQLMQSRKMAAVGTLTSGIAHELNNPLNNIGLTVEALTDGFDDYPDDEKLRMLEQVYSQVERASATVKNLLDFTRKEQPAFAPLSVKEIVETTARLAGNELKLAGIELDMDVAEGLPLIKGNARSLQQVFLNLFLNAIHAMPDGGELIIRAEAQDDGFVRIDVGDTGQGIPAENIDKVFDPFFTTKDPGKGTGLGLSVSHSTIEKHGGRITVASEVGKGTRFSVYLPTDGKG
ncbi:MAG: HAMP domain-containing protein [Deltaproteobacteria bacterium]|nr:HAMP domain-containing protein [Deltaproteobacteria bacterium]